MQEATLAWTHYKATSVNITKLEPQTAHKLNNKQWPIISLSTFREITHTDDYEGIRCVVCRANSMVGHISIHQQKFSIRLYKVDELNIATGACRKRNTETLVLLINVLVLCVTTSILIL